MERQFSTSSAVTDLSRPIPPQQAGPTTRTYTRCEAVVLSYATGTAALVAAAGVIAARARVATGLPVTAA